MPNTTAISSPGDYDRRREYARRVSAERSRLGRTLPEIPPPANAGRYERCRLSLRSFCEEYLPRTFTLPWSPTHIEVMAMMESVLRDGGLFAEALPRGFGKTTIAEAATLWALVYRLVDCVSIIGPEEDHAAARIRSLRVELETNDLLLADFASVCLPFREMEGIHQRKLLYRGQPVRMEFGANKLVLPFYMATGEGGAAVTTSGITGQIRGLLYKRPDGGSVRPSLAILDDPQTDESARSPTQCAERERIINGAVLGLAGPGKGIGAIMPCTVIHPDDLADRMTDRKRNPQWQGVRKAFLVTWPKNRKLWDEYIERRRTLQASDGGSTANTARLCAEFYQARRREMDEGAEVLWDECREPAEVSAIQHAFNLISDRGESAFKAEYQNQPMRTDSGPTPTLTTAQIAGRLNSIPRGVVALGSEHLTAFIDVHDALLYWAVVAWSQRFSGWVVDYGTWPDQGRRAFSLANATRTMQRKYPSAGREGAIRQGLQELTDSILAREWVREDGVNLRVAKCMIDSGYVPDVVHDFCRHSDHAAILLPSRGQGIGAVNKPLAEYTRKPGERYGLNWMIGMSPKRAGRYGRYNTNYWKSRLVDQLGLALGDNGAITLYGRDPAEHGLLWEHFMAETATAVTANGRTVAEWRIRPGIADNHWLDCMVGCMVAASILGVAIPGTTARVVRQPNSFADRYAAWRSRRGQGR